MSSSQVTSLPSSGGPAWQIDIPGLTTLLLNIGAEGLRKIAQADVHAHTIGCMLALGEFTPACVEFRLSLQRSRKAQKGESLWMHSLVEIGAGTNFVIDQFMMTRAGENMIALLCSTVSLLSEHQAITTLSLLFEEANASASSTPSLGQIQSIRTIALSLARRMDFKDQVFKIHVWLSQKISTRTGIMDNSLSGPNHHLAVPDTSTLIFLITTLKSLSMGHNPKKQRLVYCGLPGAAWLIVYASKVLGLFVSIVLANGEVLPVAGSYDSAIVLVYPDTPKSSVIETITDPSETIIQSSEPSDNRQNWLLHCGVEGVDFLGLLFKRDIKDRSEIGNLTFSVALEYCRQLSSLSPLSIASVNKRMGNLFRSYYSQSFDRLETSLIDVLVALGLPSNPSEVVDWRQQYFVVHDIRYCEEDVEMDNPNGNDEVAIRSIIDISSDFWGMLKRSGIDFHSCDKQQQWDELSRQKCEWRTHIQGCDCLGAALFRSICRIACLAASLSFSDWAEHFQKLSISALGGHPDGLQQHDFELFKWNFFTEAKPAAGDTIEIPRYVQDAFGTSNYLLNILTFACAPTGKDLFLKANIGNCLGIDLDGVLFVQNVAMQQDLNGHRPYVIRNGCFSLNGDRRPLLKLDGHNKIPRSGIETGKFTAPTASGTSSDSLLDVWASLDSSSIFLRYEFQHQQDSKITRYEINPHRLYRNLRRFLVGQTCGHPYKPPNLTSPDMTLLSNYRGREDEHEYWKDKKGNIWSPRYKLIEHERTYGGPTDELIFVIVPFEGGGQLVQWAAASLIDSDVTAQVVLPGQMCLDCITKHFQASHGLNRVIILPNQ